MIMGKVLCIMMAFIVGRKGDKICNDFNDVLWLISTAKAREELKWADGKVLKAELDMEVRDSWSANILLLKTVEFTIVRKVE